MNQMNKSTPLSQLPLNGTPNNFVADAPKAMMAPLPASAPQTDVPTEDDATIQEVLNQISSTPSAAPMTPSVPFHTEQPPPYVGSTTYTPQTLPPQLLNYAQNTMPSLDVTQSLNALYNMPMPPAPSTLPAPGIASSLDQFLRLFADDLKVATIVFFVVIGVHFVPYERMLGTYFAIDKIPYHDVLLKAVATAVVVLLVRRFLSK